MKSLQKMFTEHLPGLRNYGRHGRIYMEKYLFERNIRLIIESKFINSEVQDMVHEP